MRLAGTTLRLRMTVIRLSDGKLWIHSPTELTDRLREEVRSLGQVGYIVAANNQHNLWASQWQEAAPEARLFVATRIPAKLDLSEYALLDASLVNPWQEDLEHQFLGGVPIFDESVFLHKSSQSLMVTDLVQNHSDERQSGLAGFLQRFMLEPIGFKGICMAPPLKSRFMVKNRDVLSYCLRQVANWDFKRIIVTHGDIIEENAKHAFSELFSRFLV
jgi:hypothetical protein